MTRTERTTTSTKRKELTLPVSFLVIIGIGGGLVSRLSVFVCIAIASSDYTLD